VIKHIVIAGLAVFVLITSSGGCTGKDPVTTGGVPEINTATLDARLVVSRDFGQTVILDTVIEVDDGTTALGALAQRVNVETAYGGGFVKSIEGISSGYMNQPVTRRDWFLYVNGILTNTGGLAYRIKSGDTIHWYYRDWTFRQSVSSIIGDFPEPFLRGYNGTTVPTLVIHQEGLAAQAGKLALKLASIPIQHVSVKSLDYVTEDEMQNSNLILVGDHTFEPIAEINNLWNRLGLFCRFNNGYIEAYSFDGRLSGTFDSSAGIILAMQNPFNPKGTGACENVCWVVSGAGQEGISSAVDVISTTPDSLKYLAGAIVHHGTLFPLPY